ncbi:glycerol-3-phosphate ABC transporter permease [Thermosipho affectus]|uniref:Glycerol-3-phosphate ABC transporter permease n=1 Tax=Thermosipho affectus TaxID=660294 RepID=A0ABX3II31_9BACT|nr:sugar ABC transporter permease [Thermosipho affectus]ONN27085.1 glycerol-3-phosphate ABC transporter permease [Thermosipho affectus]
MRKLTPYFLLIPTFVIIILFIYTPAFNSFKMSFFQETYFGDKKVFVGFDNYIDLFSDNEYYNVLKNTFIYSFVSVGLTIFLSFLISQLLILDLPGTKVVRTLIFSPYAVSPAISATLWAMLFTPTAGLFSYLFQITFNLDVKWLTTKPYSMIAIIAATVWKMLPFDLIFYIAALQNIPDSILESSLMDGANGWIRMWRIKFPLVTPITFYLFIMNFTTTMFSSFGIIDIMTRGGPLNSTTNMIYRLYLDGFAFQDNGLASAQSVVMFGIMSIITYLYFKFVEGKVHYQ